MTEIYKKQVKISDINHERLVEMCERFSIEDGRKWYLQDLLNLVVIPEYYKGVFGGKL